MRGAGALGAFALHEACHLALGAALGAEIGSSMRGGSLYLEFGDLSPNEHQAVSIAGNACTGIAAELIVDTGKHRESNLAWGAAAFHAFNAFGYAFSSSGDAEYWRGAGGSRTSWQIINATHSSRIGAQLAWDSELGNYLRSRWRFGPPELPPVSVSSMPEEQSDIVAQADSQAGAPILTAESFRFPVVFADSSFDTLAPRAANRLSSGLVPRGGWVTGDW